MSILECVCRKVRIHEVTYARQWRPEFLLTTLAKLSEVSYGGLISGSKLHSGVSGPPACLIALATQANP